jgi:hypothetical protein
VIKTALRRLLEQPNAPLPISVEYRAVASTLVVAITEMVAWDDLGLWWNQAFKELGTIFSKIGANPCWSQWSPLTGPAL